MAIGTPWIRACAYDIGIGLVETRSLKQLLHTFQEVAVVTRLKTKAKKCKIVVLGQTRRR